MLRRNRSIIPTEKIQSNDNQPFEQLIQPGLSFSGVFLNQACSLPGAIRGTDFFSQVGGALSHYGVSDGLPNRGSEVIGGQFIVGNRRRAGAEFGYAPPPSQETWT
jgi:hypothetical protein